MLLSIFASLAVALARLGIYAVVSCSVTQRTYEIGIRLVIGAQRHDVLNMVMRPSIVLILIGLTGGAVGSFALTRLMATMLSSEQHCC
jgi:putative ABC transport system permease protein